METKSKYLTRYKKILKSNLKGNYLLVELLKEPELKTKSGIILTDNSSNQLGTIHDSLPTFCVVLETGPGYSDGETGNIIEGSMDCKVGNVILIPRMSVKLFSGIPGLHDYEMETIGITREDEIQMIFNSIEELDKYFEVLNNET